MQAANKEVGESIILFPLQACGIQLELSKYCAALSRQPVRSPFFQRLEGCSLQNDPYCSFIRKSCIVLNLPLGPDTYQNPAEVDFHSVGFGFQNWTQRKGSEAKALANSQTPHSHILGSITPYPEQAAFASEWGLALRIGYLLSLFLLLAYPVFLI